VQRAEFRFRSLDDAPAIRGCAHIGAFKYRAAARFRNLARYFPARDIVDVREEHRRAFPRKSQRGRAADPRRCAGDDRHFAFQRMLPLAFRSFHTRATLSFTIVPAQPGIPATTLFAALNGVHHFHSLLHEFLQRE
jgi:hypothetical protein